MKNVGATQKTLFVFHYPGGQNPTAMMDIFYVYTLSTGEWGQMPGLPAPRALMGCGMVEDAEGKRVVTVAGGIDELSSYFFDFDAG